MPRSRIALEIGTHSPWVSRLLSELGHEVIVANARNVRLIGESRKKDDRLDAQTLARLARIDPQLLYPVKHRSAQAQADLMVIRARAGLVRARTALVNTARGLAKSLRRAAARLQRAQYESGESRRTEPGTASGAGAVAGGIEALSERIANTTSGSRRSRKQSYPQVALLKQMKGVGTLIALTYMLTLEDPHRFRKSRDVGCYVGLQPGRQKLGAERAADAHQQGRRSVSANAAGAGSAAHSGTVRRGLRSATLGTEAGRAWRKEAGRNERSSRPRESWRCCCITCG